MVVAGMEMYKGLVKHKIIGELLLRYVNMT